MEFSGSEDEARRKAAQYVANMLHTPDKLEKVHLMKRNASRKLASVEAMLKTAMQSQLDGVQTGLRNLEESMEYVKEVGQLVGEVEEGLWMRGDVDGLASVLEEVRAEMVRHSQLATARENMRHLAMVPQTTEETESLIDDGSNLLKAHKNLAELENSRDDLLMEVHKLSSRSRMELDQVLEGYFEPVARLSDKLMKQVRFVLRRTLNTVRKDPKLIVTVLRIVEREEKLDADCLAQQKLTGFLPPGRPKMARQKVLEVLRTNVVERIEGNQLDERDQNKMWLVRHLELIRLITLEDLRVAKSLCQPVFPPEYNILEFYIRVYNEALTNRLKEIIATGLQDQEYVTMLSWIIQTYPGKELMGSDRLQLSKDQVPQLLDEATVLELERRYLENMKENYSKWLNNMMGLEVEDWSSSDRDPDLDSSGAFQTSAPLMVYQMIEENLQVAATISPELTRKVLVLSMDEVAAFGTTYRARAADYKAKYFRDRSKISSFTRYTIAIVNNCERFEELAIELKQRWWKAAEKAEKASSSSSSSASASLSPSGGSGKLAKNFEQVLSVFSALRTEASSYLLDEAFLDIDIQFGEILTSRWMTATDAIDTVCATLENYFEDYSYLRKKNLDAVISEARDRVARRYIAAIFAVTGGAGSANVLLNKMGRKVSVLEDADDRAKAADKVRFEAAQLKRFFRKVGGDSADFDSPFDAVSAMAEVIGADSEMLYLDVGTFTKRYPDLNQEQLFCILMVRGDMNRTECRTMAAEFVPDLGKPAGNATAQSSSTGSSSAASKSKVGTVATSVFSQVGVGSAAAAAAATASNLFSEATNVVASAVASAGASKDSTSLNPFSSGNSNRQSGGNNNPFGDDDDD